MAKGKVSTAKKGPYTSKGERRNVSRKIVNAMRRDFRLNPSLRSIFQKMDHKRLILSRPKDKSVADQFKKYTEAEQVRLRAESLQKQYQGVGIKFSACVQAVKTNYIPQLEMKFGRIDVKVKEKGKATHKGK